MVAQLLLNRSVQTVKEAEQFMNQTWDDWPKLPNQDIFIEHLTTLIEKKAAICVYGDYDVDGVTSTAMLVHILRQLGARVDYISPHRFNDGYGLNAHRMNEIAKKNYDALITVDCGVSNKNEIQQLKFHCPNITILILDHHKCPTELPIADAIVNPQLADDTHPAKHLCSAALIDYIFRTTPMNGIDPNEYIDLAAIGLVADVMPLTKLNRWYVKKGLDEIKTNPRLAILELCVNAKVNHQNITTKDIGFGIGPRLNAPGRLGDPRPVVELLLTTDPHQIRKQVQMIEKLNNQRRSIGEKIQKDIENQLKDDDNIANQKGIVCSGQFWHMGVIGINASKLVNKYNKPAIVIGFDTDIARGSARSIPGVNIYDIIKKCSDTLNHYGGHSQAAGFSLNPNQIIKFKNAFKNHCEHIKTTEPSLIIDAKLNLHQISLSFIEELEQLEPHGEGNPKPVFYAIAQLLDAKKVGKTQAHLKCRFEQEGRIIDGIGFNLANRINSITKTQVQIAFQASKNEFNGKITPQLQIIDIKEYGH